MERHSAVWGKFDGEKREGLAEGRGGIQPSTLIIHATLMIQCNETN